jgi:hypothetical protein
MLVKMLTTPVTVPSPENEARYFRRLSRWA